MTHIMEVVFERLHKYIKEYTSFTIGFYGRSKIIEIYDGDICVGSVEIDNNRLEFATGGYESEPHFISVDLNDGDIEAFIDNIERLLWV